VSLFKLLSKFLIREMSLAMFAAPIDENYEITDNYYSNQDNILNQKRHKKTQKKYPKIENFNNKINTNKVNTVLQKIHENNEEDDDDEKDLFNPPPKPVSAGVEKTIPKVENFSGLPSLLNKYVGKDPTPNYIDNNLELNDYNNYGDDKTVEEYYKNVMPGYKSIKKNPEYMSQDLLLQKLNYMITLLEEQKDEKTNNVTEEVILYCFLGVFVIFIADTFVKAGKYTR